MTMMLFYSDINAHDSALVEGTKALRGFEQSKDTLAVIKVAHELALLNQDLGVYDEALMYNLIALTSSEDLRKQRKVVHHLADRALIYADNNQFSRGLAYGKRANQQSGDKNGYNPGELAHLYHSLARNFMGLDLFDSASHYYMKTIDVFKGVNPEILNAKDTALLGRTLNYLAEVQIKNNEFDEAVENLNRAIEVIQSTKQHAYDLSKTYLLLVILKSKEILRIDSKTYNLNLLDSALKYARHSGSAERLSEVYYELYKLNKEQSESTRALSFFEKYTQLKDSIFQQRRIRSIELIETNYQLSDKEKTIALQQSKIINQTFQLQRNIIIIAALGLLFILLLTIFFYTRDRQKTRQKTALAEQARQLKEKSTTAVIHSLENEQKRIARDIHDGLGQLVSALGINLVGLKKKGQSIEEVSNSILDNSISLINNIHDEIRRIAFNLMPHRLVHDSLLEAVKELCQRINHSGQILIELSHYDYPKHLDKDTELSIYRIVQELISNIVKYANADRVDLQLIGHEDELSIVIEDNGIGFDLARFKSSDSNGWQNLSFRLDKIGATIEFDTKEGIKSSCVSISMPI